MNKNNIRIASTILISGTAVFISYMINFLVTPYITDNVGIDAYGFVSIAKTAVSYAQILTIALTNFIVRFVTVEYHKNNKREANAYYSSSLAACIVITGVIYLIMMAITYKLEYILNIPEHLIISVKILFLIVFLNFALTTIITPLSTAAFIKNRLDITGVVRILSYLCDAVVMLVLFMNFPPYIWFVGLGSLSASILTLCCNYAMTKKLTPDLKFDKALVSIKKVKDLVKNGIWNSVNSLGNVLNSGLDLIISNLFLSGTETGEIAVAKTIGTMFSTLNQVVSQPFQPQLIKTYASGDMDKFIKELHKAMKVCGYFGNIAFAGFASLGLLYFKLWLPSQDVVLLHRLTLLTVASAVTEFAMRPVYYVHTLTLKNKIPCWLTVAGGFMNVAAMYLLLKYTDMGVYAVVITTAVILISTNLFFNPNYAAWCLKVKAWLIYKVYIRHIISAIVMVSVLPLVAKLLSPSGWIGLILSALLLAVIGLVIHVLIMSGRNDYKKMIVFVKKRLH